MGIQKRFLKSKPICKVTFTMPKEAIREAKRVHIVGDFNDWKRKATPMKKLKSGSYKIVVDLPCGREYQYRYLIDGKIWENDWAADRYAPSPFYDADNSVVIVNSDNRKMEHRKSL
jgi:1,4-alpha-glucan branching enzyme